jgi:hypothetical protein
LQGSKAFKKFRGLFMLYAIPQAKLLNFIKTKSEKSIFSKKKNQTEQITSNYERNLFFYTVTFQQEEELYVEKKMKSKITPCFICKSLLYRQIKNMEG